MPLDRHAVAGWLDQLARVYSANRDLLTELDSAIGDADHGASMDRGFAAVRAELERGGPADIPSLLKFVAATLIKTVGGASGPLYGTFFLRAGAVCPAKGELDASDVVTIFRAGIDGVVQRGKASAGDKTMGDALLPALAAMEDCGRRAAGIGRMLEEAAEAAGQGMRATIPMQARKGRASYLGPRSVGHQDPGATSTWLLFRAAADTWREA